MHGKERPLPAGRSKSEPAIQNIPLRTKLGKQVAEAFRSKSPIIDVDYAELERRILRENPPPHEC